VRTGPALIFVAAQCLEQAQVPVGEELAFPGPQEQGCVNLAVGN
jgi:hypothetical protein